MSDNKEHLQQGSPLIVGDLDVTMKVVTYYGPYYHSFVKRLWLHLTCRHDMTGKWLETVFCKKCGLIRRG